MKVILDIAENYTGFPQGFEEMRVKLMALHQYDIRGSAESNYKSIADIEEQHWFKHWHDRTTDHSFKDGKAIGITKNKYYVFVIDMVDISGFVSLVADKEFTIKLCKTDYVEVEYKLSLR